MSANNIVRVKIEAAKLEIETTIEDKIDGIKADYMKKIDSLDIKISAITSNKTASSSDQSDSDLIKWPLLKSLENLHMHRNSPNIFPPWTIKYTLYFKLKKCGMPFDPWFTNPYQKTTAGLHTSHSK